MKLKYNWVKIQSYYNTGKSIRECCEHFGVTWGAIRKAIIRNDFKTSRNISDAMKLAYKTGRAKVTDKTDDGIKRLRESAIRNELGGKRNSKRFKYNGVNLDSSYEVRMATLLDKQNIKWNRPCRIIWKDKNGIEHRYYADFYLTEHDLYIDTKNKYLAMRDVEKIKAVCEQNNVKVRIVEIEELIVAEKNGFIL